MSWKLRSSLNQKTEFADGTMITAVAEKVPEEHTKHMQTSNGTTFKYFVWKT